MTARELVLKYLESFSTGDAGTVAGYVSDDFDNRQMGQLGTGCRGAETYRERLGDFLAAFQKLQYQVDDMVVEGDKVAVAYRMTFEQDGKQIAIPGAMLFKLRDGLIAERSDYWDGMSYLRQTGADQ